MPKLSKFLEFSRKEKREILSSSPYPTLKNLETDLNQANYQAFFAKLKLESPEIYLYLLWKSENVLEGAKDKIESRLMPPHLRCLEKACFSLNLEYKGDAKLREIWIQLKGQEFLFANFTTPFNSQIAATVSKDKDRCYHRLKSKTEIKQPQTLSFLNPKANAQYDIYKTASTNEEVAEKILDWGKSLTKENGDFKLILKPNQGSLGKDVFLCENRKQILAAVEKIYTSDYILLAQEFLKIKREFRVISYQGEIALIYEKISSRNKDAGSFYQNLSQPEQDSNFLPSLSENKSTVKDGKENLSPLHQLGSEARYIELEGFKHQPKFGDICASVYQALGIEYTGLDLVETESGEIFLIEVNASPGFNHFLTDNNSEFLVEMYRNILIKWIQKA